MKVGILTISDRGVRGEYEDRSGPLITEIIGRRTSWQVSHQAIVADDVEEIKAALLAWCQEGVHLILTTGGTGFSPRDVTPEATRQVIERETPGIAEAMRAESLKVTQHAMLSRAVAGIRGQTLIVNLPGNPKAVKENMDVLLPVLPHALQLLSDHPGSESEHRTV
ncbi:MAG: MogA/MoaB family molybdenum cofactor biosynthesis protein [Chloroflexi bacterium]|nr:MogA/MoaB family molybdenum cofactor biosynthesis protein [Chloroflexota bacterium]MCI0649765.1 MogA/MoaB family molybdenum cofactor biosynthesis protein [Chloroflexota bacterium]MCI0730210.1 MogA/MoaB family molybdenum cofactor biosynthesis protein [Chloroflexota bacterium]